METKGQARDRHGRLGTARVVELHRSDEAELDYWRSRTPEERVAAVHDCLKSSLKAQGLAA